ncbi:MAG TPA: histidinol-phosphate transaminase, partial [Candidatus Paceibacterota bacterium]|nr:histidinol-phosphate transaminase [Candidatus Paceibacterota bacterium]
SATVGEVNRGLRKYTAIINRMERGVDWRVGCPFRKPAACFHGGAFFDAIGTGFENLGRRNQIINADVLDAWFPPAPGVITALQENLPWLLRTSPPTACDGMIRAVAAARGIPEDCVLPGAGSSALIFLALRQWLSPESRVLILDPMYGEYAHVLEHVVRCRVDRLRLSRDAGYRVDLSRLEALLRRRYDLVILVNPNSPTGQHIPRAELAAILAGAPETTRIWVDETYIEFMGAGESLEPVAARRRNLMVCKSMSKVYALSGLRAAYLCGPAALIETLRSVTPPWAVSLPAQVAVVAALKDPDYYAERYAETHRLRAEFATELAARVGWKVLPGVANFLLCLVPDQGLTAEEWCGRCRARGLFVRDVGAMGRHLGRYALRIAVKDCETNFRMVQIIAEIAAAEQKARTVPVSPFINMTSLQQV